MITHRFFSLSSSLTLAAAISFGSLTTQPAMAGNTAVPEVTVGPTVIADSPTIRQQQWLKATPDQRIRLAELIGEDGARAMASSKGWKPLMDGTTSTLRQGFDQVYQSADGLIHVVEAKGGGSQLGNAYGYMQGSAEWAVRAAERTLNSSIASASEKEAARAVLNAARSSTLEVHVIRTRHVLGEPTAAVLEQTVRGCDGTATLASAVVDDLARRGVTVVDQAATAGRGLIGISRSAASTDASGLAPTFIADTAQAVPPAIETVGTATTIARGAAKIALPVAVLVDAGLRVDKGVQIERQFATGELTEQQREIAHAKNAAGMAGGWSGAWAGAELGTIGGGAAGTFIAPGPGTAIGAGAGAIAGGVAGYVGGQAAAEAGAEWAVTKVHKTGTTLAVVGASALDGTKRLANATGKACSNGWNWTASKGGAAWHWAKGD